MESCRSRPPEGAIPPTATGIAALDRLLPGGGIAGGSLLEILEPGPACGSHTFAAALCRSAGRRLIVFDRTDTFYPPAAFAWGWGADRLLVIRPRDDMEETWAAVQALRSPAVGAVWLWRDRLATPDARRLRLAAEEGGTLGVVFRPERDRGQPSWADVQFSVAPQPGGLRVEVTRCRGGFSRAPIDVSLEDLMHTPGEDADEAVRLPVPATLADSATARRAAGTPPRAARRSRTRRTAW
jgi:hypothetical protein